jgi:hypothetical protein
MNTWLYLAVVFVISVGLLVAPLLAQPAAAQERSGSKGAPTKTERQSVAPASKEISWRSHELRDRVERIIAENDRKLNPRDAGGASENDVCELLRKKFTKAEMHQLAASFDSAPTDPRKWASYQYLIRDALFDMFRWNGDRDGLVTLLSTSCFREEGFKNDLEFLIAVNDKLTDPIQVLGDAYAKAKSPETRRNIAAAVRRAFGGQGVTGRDDGELVKNAMEWYRKNREDLIVDPVYAANFDLSRMLGQEIYAKNPLFIRKPKTEKSKSAAVTHVGK